MNTNCFSNRFRFSNVLIKILFCSQDEADKSIKLSSRERRFIKFASVQFDGQLYMTPQDFLDSVVEQEPRRKYKAFYLCRREIKLKRILSRSSPEATNTDRRRGKRD